MRLDLRVARLAKKLTDAVLAEVRGASVGELVAAVASRPSAERSRVPSRATKRNGAKRSGGEASPTRGPMTSKSQLVWGLGHRSFRREPATV